MIILVGASASGKTAIAKYLIENYHFNKFVTTTTRSMRVGEKQNIDYHFVSDEEFDRKVNNKDFIEYVEYNSKKYGSEKKEIGTNKILIIEPIGLIKYLSLNDRTIVTFYIECDKCVRNERMINRNDDPLDIKKRLANDETLFTDEVKNKTNFVIDSSKNNVEEIANQIYKLYLNKITSSN